MFETWILKNLLSNPRCAYRNVNLVALAFILLFLGLGVFAGYEYFGGVNPVREENYARISGTFDSIRKWKSEHTEGLNIKLREYQRTFSPIIDLDVNKEADLLKNELPGNPVDMIVDRAELAKARVMILGLEMCHVDIYELKTPKNKYLSLEESVKDFADEKKSALIMAVIMPLCGLIILPYLIVKKKDQFIDKNIFESKSGLTKFMQSYIEFRAVPFKILMLISGNILFMALGVYMVINGEDGYMKLVGYFITGFFSLAFLGILKDYVHQDRIVLITREGIDDRRMKIGLIPWNDIQEVSVWRLNYVNFLALTLNNESYYFERMPVQERFFRKFNAFFHYPKFYIYFVVLTPSLDTAIDYILAVHPEKFFKKQIRDGIFD